MRFIESWRVFYPALNYYDQRVFKTRRAAHIGGAESAINFIIEKRQAKRAETEEQSKLFITTLERMGFECYRTHRGGTHSYTCNRGAIRLQVEFDKIHRVKLYPINNEQGFAAIQLLEGLISENKTAL